MKTRNLKILWFVRTKLVVLALILIADVGAQENIVARPWLELAKPTLIEWTAIQWQADWGEPEFGENGVTVNFFLGPRSASLGIIYCDLAYLPSTSAELVDIIEKGIKRRVGVTRKLIPWAKVEIISRVNDKPLKLPK